MWKPRNVIIICVLSFVLLAVVSIFVEIGNKSRQAASVNSLIPVAADIAIEQGQSIDDAFNSTEIGYGLERQTALKLLVDDANLYGKDSSKQFKTVELFPFYYNKTGKKQIYESMFINGVNGIEFRDWAQKSKAVKRKYRVFGIGGVGGEWIEIPKIANMGLNTFSTAQNSIFPQTTEALEVYKQYELKTYCSHRLQSF